MKLISFIITIMFISVVIIVPSNVYAQNILSNNNNTLNLTNLPDLSGLYLSDSQDKYYVRNIDDSIWWVSISKNDSSILNIFKGIINKNKIIGTWIDSPLRKTTGFGNLNMSIDVHSQENITLNSNMIGNKYSSLHLVKFIPESIILPRIFVVLDSIRIEIPRAPTNDVLYVGLSAKKDFDNPIASTRYLGNRGENSNITLDLKVGPFDLDKKDKGITINFLGINKAGARTPQSLINLQDTLFQLLDPIYSWSNPYQANSIVRSISPGLLPGGCNGLVFADKIFISTEDIKKMLSTDSTSIEKYYEGVESPTGCGPNSKYYVKYSIMPVE